MNLNATILGQAIAFVLIVLFCMKYVWPPLMAAIEKRQKEIADGLASAERAHKDLDLAKASATDQLKKAKAEAQVIIEQSHYAPFARQNTQQIIQDTMDWQRSIIKLRQNRNVLKSWPRRRRKLKPSVNVPVKSCVSKLLSWLLLAPRRSSNVPWMKLLIATSWTNLSLNCKEGGADV